MDCNDNFLVALTKITGVIMITRPTLQRSLQDNYNNVLYRRSLKYDNDQFYTDCCDNRNNLLNEGSQNDDYDQLKVTVGIPLQKMGIRMYVLVHVLKQ